MGEVALRGRVEDLGIWPPEVAALAREVGRVLVLVRVKGGGLPLPSLEEGAAVVARSGCEDDAVVVVVVVVAVAAAAVLFLKKGDCTGFADAVTGLTI